MKLTGKKTVVAIQSQKGAALLIAIAILGVLIAALIMAVSQMFDQTVKQLTRQRERTAALQVLQEFAVLAQRANDRWVRNGGAACPGGTTARPAQFCWPNPFPSPNICVASPLGGGADICLQSAGVPPAAAPGVGMWVAEFTFAPKEQNIFQEWKSRVAQYWSYREEIILEAQRRILSLTGNQAYALRPQLMLPDDAAPAGPGDNVINNLACNAGSGNYYCKQCAAASVWCAELRVCVSPSGCRNIATSKDWYRQRIGIIRRY